jgi:hypothetical protein
MVLQGRARLALLFRLYILDSPCLSTSVRPGMHTSPQSRVSPTVISGALIVLSALWFISAYAFYVANSQSKDGWSAAPLVAMLALVVVPFVAPMLTFWLLAALRAERKRMRPGDYIAVATAAAPFIIVGIFVVGFILE